MIGHGGASMRINFRSTLNLLGVLLSCLICACMRFGPDYVPPEPPADMPSAYQHAPPGEHQLPAPPDDWWHTFQDPGRPLRPGHRNDVASHLAQVRVQLIEGENRQVSTIELTKLWCKAVGRIPDAEAVSFRSTLHSFGNAIEVDLSIDDDDQLLAASEELKHELQRHPDVSDIEDSFLHGKTEMQLNLKPAAANLVLIPCGLLIMDDLQTRAGVRRFALKEQSA